MTPEQIKIEIWARMYADQAVQIVNMLTDLNLAQQRIKALEEAAKPTADVIPIKKEE